MGSLLGLMRVLRASEHLLLLQVPIEVIECFLKDLIRRPESWFVSNRVDGFPLDLYQEALGFGFHLKM